MVPVEEPSDFEAEAMKHFSRREGRSIRKDSCLIMWRC